MPRNHRIEYPSAVYHVISRGNYRKELFLKAKTGEAFERCLFEAVERHAWREHGQDPTRERNRGQVPLSTADFRLLPFVWREPDVIERGKSEGSYILKKQLFGELITVQSRRSLKHRLMSLRTFWKRK